MNLPNALTLVRIFLVPLLVAALVQQSMRVDIGGRTIVANDFFALIVFLAAAATDMLDGYLARRWKQVTTVGTLLDPIADKLLISAAMISLVQIRMLPGWLVILVIGREFAVTGLRGIAAAEGYVIKASELGKTKMVLQVAGVALIMMSVRWPRLHPYALFVMWAVVVFGLWSAMDYFWKFWRVLDEGVKHRRRLELLELDRNQRKLDRAARSLEEQSTDPESTKSATIR